MLVNDLDLWITDESNTTLYRPWNLDPANPSAAAVRPVENVDPPPAEDNRNHRDNVEQVLIDAPASGEYIIHVGRTGSTFNQDYSLLVSGADLTAPVLSLTAPLATEVEWTWPDAVGENDYLVYKYDGGSVYLATLAANSTSYTATVLTPGASQNFMVVARNSLGNTNSGWQQINTPALLKPTVTLVEIAPGSVRVNWTDSNGESKFFLYRGDVDVNGNPANWAYQNTQSSGVGPRSFTFSGLTLEKEYAFQVKAVGGPNDTTAKSDPQIIETSKANTPVLALTPLTPTSVKLDWPDAAGEDNYHIYRFNYDENEVPQGSTFLGTFAADMITYTATGLDTDRLVEFQVKAVYPSGTVDSARAAIITPKLDEPVVSVTVESASEVDLNWDDSSGETSYYVYRYDYDQTGSTGSTFLGTFAAGTVEHTDSGLNANWYYEYQVTAVYVGSTVDSDRVAARTPAALLLAEADRATEVNDPTVADDRQLAALIDEAIRRWTDSLLVDDGALALLDEVTFEIVDLAGLTLGKTTGNTILIDSTAAGHGWFIDFTPYDDTVFTIRGDGGELVAAQSSDAVGRMDLLTVVSHELGHILGLEDLG
ncbi:MAG: fibronectin type III domain-containing protein, partial [Acidobacteria bacterium]|nr:fibronectin type III domain-containing protein [Acidobacteriota bacterium]